MIATISNPKTKRELLQALEKLKNPKLEIHELTDQKAARSLDRRLRYLVRGKPVSVILIW